MRLAWRVSSASDPATSSTPTSSADSISQKSTSCLYRLTTRNGGSRRFRSRLRPPPERSGGRKASGEVGRLLALLDGLGLDFDGDLLADEHSAGLQGLV